MKTGIHVPLYLTCVLYKLAILGFECPNRVWCTGNLNKCEMNELEPESSHFCSCFITELLQTDIPWGMRLLRVRMIVLEGSLETVHFTVEEMS